MAGHPIEVFSFLLRHSQVARTPRRLCSIEDLDGFILTFTKTVGIDLYQEQVKTL
jgi:hypothetical protein